MKVLTIQSSNILHVGYLQDDLELYIHFASLNPDGDGAWYRYDDVETGVVTRLLFAESSGKFFAAHIKGQYPFVKTEEPEDVHV